jgi:hypothetical protein
MARIEAYARLAAVLSSVALLPACEFVRVAPVPGIPASQSPGTPTPISTLTTQEVCMLRLQEGYFDEAIDELNFRGEFSDFEIAEIRAARVAIGMGEAAVRCSFGEPQRVLTRSATEEYDMAYEYDRVFMGVETRVFFEMGVVVGSVDTPRSNRSSLIP